MNTRYKIILINNTNKISLIMYLFFHHSFGCVRYSKYENDCRHNITCICIPYYMHQCITDFRFMIQTENYLSYSVIQIFRYIFFELLN